MTRYPSPRPRAITPISRTPYLCFGFIEEAALAVTVAGLLVVAEAAVPVLEAGVAVLKVVAVDPVSVADVVADAAVPVAVPLAVFELAPEEVSIKTPPGLVLAEVLEAVAEEVLELEVVSSSALPSQVPVDLMLW
jgi:hypothetical protein